MGKKQKKKKKTKAKRLRGSTTWPVESGEIEVRVDWGQSEGRWEAQAIRLRTRDLEATGPITSTTLRALPLGRIVAMIRAQHEELGGVVEPAGELPIPDELTAARERGERTRLGEEHYEAVAAVYQEAYGSGRSPTKAVADRFSVSPSTAASWVSRARHRYGLLPETRSGKATG